MNALIRFACLIVALVSASSASPQNAFSIKANTREFSLQEKSRTILRIARREKDRAFLAARCVIVRRNVRETELFPEVDALETYTVNGSKRIYFEKDLSIRRLSDARVLNSPDNSWAVVPDEEEGKVRGFFRIASDCSILEVAFPSGNAIYWREIGGHFIDDKTLLLPDLDLEGSNKKRIKITIHKDGTYQIQNASSQ
jgi:hypothetical protein